MTNEKNQDALKELEKELSEIGLELIKQADVEGNYGLGIEIDLDTEVDYSHLVEADFIMRKLTKRKDFFYITLKSYNKDIKRLTLFVGAPISEDIFNYYKETNLNKIIGTNFPDLCWYFSEGTTLDTVGETETTFREDAKMGDLTWYLPSRMIDNFIEIMHTMNHSFLQGLMQDTICYGPYLMSDKNIE